MPTANQTAFDRGVSHAIHMQRLKTGEVNKIVGFLNDKVLPDAKQKLAARLERLVTRGMDKGPHTTKRVKDMINSVTGTISGGLREASAKLRVDLKDIALTEAEWQQSVLRSSVPGELGLSFNVPTAGQLNSIITSRPFEGDLLRGWWKKLDRAKRSGISEQIQIGIAEGETNAQIIRRLAGTKSGAFMDGAFGKMRRNVAAVTQTATQHVAAQAREMTYKENDDIIKGVQIVATLDSRTTEICMSEDGKVYPVEEGPRPPFHWNCRTTTIPVLKSFKELGFNAPDLPAATRASVDGQVPARQTYQGWLRGQPAAVQDDALGPVKGRLFRKHKLEVTSFVDDRRRTLTIDQLRVKEGLVPKIPPPAPAAPAPIPPSGIKPVSPPREKIQASQQLGDEITYKNTDRLSDEFEVEFQTVASRKEGGSAYYEMRNAIGVDPDDFGLGRVITRSSDGKINGAISWMTSENEMLIADLGALKARGGSGSELMRYALQAASQQNLSIVLPSLPDAVGFYERLGFIQRAKGFSEFTASTSRVKLIEAALGKPGRGL